VGTGVSGVYEGSKDFGKEISTDITRIFKGVTVTDSDLSKDGSPGYITDSAGVKVGYVAASGKVTYASGYLGGYQDAGTKIIPSIPDSLVISRGMTPQEALKYALGAADIVKTKGQVIDAGTQYLPDSSSTAKLLGQVANAVGYTPANPAVATAAAKIVSSGNPVSQLGGATLAKGVSYTRGGVTYTGG
ncbi:MAG: hypothetical protein NTU93_18615, partial [Arthrobacter sp.]|nr:hypothetical protein [Arthrobacter sp.]